MRITHVSRLPADPDGIKRPRDIDIIFYVRSQWDTRTRQVVALHERGETFEAIGEVLDCHPTTAHRDWISAQEQLRLAVEAPWMEEFREKVLAGEKPPLPKALVTLYAAGITAMRDLSVKQIQSILESKHTVASRIARDTKVTLRQVLAVLKEHGRWPLIQKESLIVAYHEAGGNITKAAELLGLERTRVYHLLKAMGLRSTDKRFRQKDTKVIET